MVRKDSSRIAVERAVTVIGKVRAIVKNRMPYGPDKVSMSPREARQFISKMDGEARLALSEKMGPEAWDDLMDRLYGQGG